ncbi:hypothetical protein AB2M62_03310 [Sphingomonas sp. MMS12-HWE2-04]|uniref:hypothetical protein n=1 Tax=Sphingomonas sp. MMS12-HWE2-04 TaxID=3234199 RepID=UPI00384EC43C
MTTAFDLIKKTKQIKADSYEFHLHMPTWRKFDPGIALKWQRTKFNVSGKEDVPEVRGLYVFTLEAEKLGLPTHGYILYVGITGNKSKANLRKRFGQYLLEAKKQNGRPLVMYMLNEWPDDLFFNFMAVPDGAIDLAKIERSFINTVLPPINASDFDGDIGPAKKAAF